MRNGGSEEGSLEESYSHLHSVNIYLIIAIKKVRKKNHVIEIQITRTVFKIYLAEAW